MKLVHFFKTLFLSEKRTLREILDNEISLLLNPLLIVEIMEQTRAEFFIIQTAICLVDHLQQLLLCNLLPSLGQDPLHLTRAEHPCVVLVKQANRSDWLSLEECTCQAPS